MYCLELMDLATVSENTDTEKTFVLNILVNIVASSMLKDNGPVLDQW